jgi:hypothetical protein
MHTAKTQNMIKLLLTGENVFNRLIHNLSLEGIFELKQGEISERISKKGIFSMRYSWNNITEAIKKHDSLRDKCSSQEE